MSDNFSPLFILFNRFRKCNKNLFSVPQKLCDSLQVFLYIYLRVLAGGILNFSGTLLGELIFLAQGDVLGILVHFWGS